MTLWSNSISTSCDHRRCCRRVLLSFTKPLICRFWLILFLRPAVKRPHNKKNSFHIVLRSHFTASSLARWHFMITVLLVCVELTDQFGRMMTTLFAKFE